MMEYRHCVCVPPGTYSTPNGVGQTGKDRLQKGLTVNSDTVVLGTWKINKVRLVRMVEEHRHSGRIRSTENKTQCFSRKKTQIPMLSLK